MKAKQITFLAVIFAVLLGVGLIFWLLGSDKSSVEKQASAEEVLTSQLEKACQVFSLEDAKTLLGENAVKATDSNTATSSSDDIAVSQCAYVDSPNYDQTASEVQKRASLVVRSPRTDSGRQTNQSVFSATLPEGAVAVPEIGDKAFWNPQFGQLNVFKSGDWYVLEYGSVVPTSRNQGETERFAKLLIDVL